MQPYVVQLVAFDCRQRFGHAVDERLDANETGLRTLSRLGDQIFTAAKADFKLDIADRRSKQRGECVWRPLTEVKREARQQRIEEPRLLRPQLMPLAPAEEGAWLTG